MSDNEAAAPEVQVEELPQELKDIKAVLYQARGQQALTKGIRQSLKVIENKKAFICFLADDCDNDDYKNLVKALCQEQGVQIIAVEKKEQLGEFAAQCKYDAEGKAKKVNACSCAVIGKIRMSDELKRITKKN